MRNIQILDCTLRDGGRVIDCEYSDNVIADLTKGLTDARIDIIEMGFLRSHSLVKYEGNSTFFTEVSQIVPFIPKKRQNAKYVAFVDFNMYDFSRLEKCDGKSITGLRVGFTKKQFEEQRDEIRNCLHRVKEQGYELFVQGVNSLAYTDRELLELVDMMNEIVPYSFGIVDTYGAMYLEDMIHYYNLVDYNLNEKIHIDIHSHNNFQSSFAFAQQIVIQSGGGKRQVILDATLNGMGKCAGNLNTELIVDYLSRKYHYDYDTDAVLDMIDRYLYPIKKEHEWGYSIPAFMAGLYKSHPNNVIYLTEKYRLNSKDIKYILSGIDETTRQKYDYDNIQQVYKAYSSSNIEDRAALDQLSAALSGREILVLAPGNSIVTCKAEIKEYIEKEDPIVICVNFMPEYFSYDYLFYANTIHWERVSKRIDRGQCILTSNIHTDIEDVILINYSRLIEEDSVLGDNSTIMLLNLLKLAGVSRIKIAGFDGLRENANNYMDETFPDERSKADYETSNKEVSRLYKRYRERVAGKITISFLTESMYEE